MSKETPKNGWTKVAFGDVVKLSKERSKDPAADGFERYVGLEHIEPEDLKIRRWGNVADGTTFTNVFRPGQVLFGKRRAYQRKVAVADFSGICSSDIYVFEPRDGNLLPELLPFICQSEMFFQFALDTSSGSLSPRTNWNRLENFELLLPSMAKQKRICELLVATERLLAGLKNTVSLLERLRMSLIVQRFSHILENKSIRQTSVEEAGQVLMGRQRSPIYDQGNSPRPYLRVANVFDGYIDTTDVKQMDFSEQEFARYRLIHGDVLLNEGQSTELVGRSAIYKEEIPNVCFQNTLIRFRPTGVVDSDYAHRYFQFCQYTGRFAAISMQTTSVAHLGVTRFSKLPIPVMPHKGQQRIVNEIGGTVLRLQLAHDRARYFQNIKKQLLEKHIRT